MLRVAEVGQGREAQSRTQWRDGKGWKARARWGAYKRRIATNPGCISISSARSVDPLRKLQATPRSATPLGRYVVFMAAFEPLQRRSAGFHRPDIVESLKCTAVLMSVFCIY